MNDDPESKPDFADRVKSMTFDELKLYEKSAIFLSRSLTIVGVLMILACLIFPTISVIIPCALIVILLSNMAVNTGLSLTNIREALGKHKDK